MHWTKLSPDLGYPKDIAPPPDRCAGAAPPGSDRRRDPSLALSTAKRGVIWWAPTTA